MTRRGNLDFGSPTEEFYRAEVELPFLRRHLLEHRDEEDRPPALETAVVFECGTNVWRRYESWPPADATPLVLSLRAGGCIVLQPSTDSEPTPEPQPHLYDEWISDPASPVPYTEQISTGMDANHMSDDQRFAARRPDVMVYQIADTLAEDVTVVGAVNATLRVSTSGTDADFIVKLIDVYPGDYPAPPIESAEEQAGRPWNGPSSHPTEMGGYQQLVRAEPFRGKFRHSFENPQPFVPGEPSLISFSMPDVCHCFRKGHRISVQVCSSWFPLVDRNPQTFCNVFTCGDEAFQAATHRVYEGSTVEIQATFGARPAEPRDEIEAAVSVSKDLAAGDNPEHAPYPRLIDVDRAPSPQLYPQLQDKPLEYTAWESEAIVVALRTAGCALLSGAIGGTELESMRRELLSYAEHEGSPGNDGMVSVGSRNFTEMFNRHPRYLALLEPPDPIPAALREALGAQYKCISQKALRHAPGHNDWRIRNDEEELSLRGLPATPPDDWSANGFQ